jgi:nucleoside-diphosphate-sugar epimerase
MLFLFLFLCLFHQNHITYLGTNAKAVRELGYNPRSLEEGLPETLHYEMQLLGMK